jgi:hypothetical protein
MMSCRSRSDSAVWQHIESELVGCNGHRKVKMNKLFIVLMLSIVSVPIPGICQVKTEQNTNATALVPVSAAKDDSKGKGIVCIDPLPKYRYPEGSNQKTEYKFFKIQIDKLPPMEIAAGEPGLFENLSTDKKHLVKIECDGKRLTSFWFTFQQYDSTHLRLWYGVGYDSWSLSPAGKRHKCAYKKQKDKNQQNNQTP